MCVSVCFDLARFPAVCFAIAEEFGCLRPVEARGYVASFSPQWVVKGFLIIDDAVPLLLSVPGVSDLSAAAS